jgi:predicted enzyme related to lactoylglutathione lyase
MKLIVDIKVQNLQRAIHFYTQSLGLESGRIEKNWAAIHVGTAQIHLFINGGVTKDIEFYVDNIDKKVAELDAKGIIFNAGMHKPHAISVDAHNITTFPWGRTAFFNDSEGNELAIVQDFE